MMTQDQALDGAEKILDDLARSIIIPFEQQRAAGAAWAALRDLRAERDALLAACKLAVSWVVSEEAADALRNAISMAETGRPYEYEPPEVQEAFLAEYRRVRAERAAADPEELAGRKPVVDPCPACPACEGRATRKEAAGD